MTLLRPEDDAFELHLGERRGKVFVYSHVLTKVVMSTKVLATTWIRTSVGYSRQ